VHDPDRGVGVAPAHAGEREVAPCALRRSAGSRSGLRTTVASRGDGTSSSPRYVRQYLLVRRAETARDYVTLTSNGAMVTTRTLSSVTIMAESSRFLCESDTSTKYRPVSSRPRAKDENEGTYIGSTIASACLDSGIVPVILDSLVTGRREFTKGRLFYEGDIGNDDLIDEIFADHPDIFAVVHCAALIVVPDSVANPLRYYGCNVVRSLEMVGHLLRNGCSRLLFSSSAAIYGPAEDSSVDENSIILPVSPYARTKAVCEAMFADIAAAGSIRVLSLRYFNPIGADPKMRTGLQLARPSHALGKLIQASEEGTAFSITGTDYPTRDGSGIRDYIHVWDLAAAHVAALRKFDSVLGTANSVPVNLGTGSGTTVRELVQAFNRVTDKPVRAIEAPRRPGDSTGAFSRSDRARRLLGWTPQYSIEEGIEHSLRWASLRDRILDPIST
jgi:UDP-glucose 4-epimerase